MKTEISKFCERALSVLEPLPNSLNTAAARLEEGPDKAALREPLGGLNDIRARLRSLLEKLRHQQAYLIIFGPLKSGKSTLMNAISSAYVSEVTSLPGYPCLVYVRHAEEPHFSATRYNGRETVFADGKVLADVIADSHVALAQQIRATEMRGENFEPGIHFTEAIRRIDIKVKIPALAESKTVLVDTPGLYSRMNFGYDILTREFRDSAACAVFIVKTDNLYLEQVFAEFNQLLDLFSRIFLVVNVDTSKRDLLPDGTLGPSAESRNPEKVVEAFKTLAMAGPMRQAHDEGRLRIHAVDLLNAASASLTGNETDSMAGSKAAFDAFMADLTEYLNSSDYTREFISDSLRQGYTLCGEVRSILVSEPMKALEVRQAELGQKLTGLNERIEAAERLLKVDWDACFAAARQQNTDRFEQTLTARTAQVGKDLQSALDSWYETSEPFKALEQRHWNPVLREAGQALAEETRGRLRRLLDTPLGGTEPSAAVMTDLHLVGFTFSRASQAALKALEPQEPSEAYTVRLPAEAVPVRKSVVDWLLFRGAATVRRRILGEDLEREITPEEKHQRLPEPTRLALQKIAADSVAAKFPELPQAYSERLLTAYIKEFCADVVTGLQDLRDRLVLQRTEQEKPHQANARVLEAVGALGDDVTRTLGELNKLSDKEGLPELIVEPEKPAELPPPAAPESVAVEPAPVEQSGTSDTSVGGES